MNLLNPKKLDQLIIVMLSGVSIREAARRIPVTRGTARKYYHLLVEIRKEQPICSCGQPAIHRGWCFHRYKNSLKRQLFMKKWHPIK
jgi:hypothetical protein